MNADDFGLSEGVNRAIMDCVHSGILRSASLMPNGAAFEDALRVARRTPELGVGIHLTLVGECCVAPRRDLGGLVDAAGLLPASYAAFARGFLSRRFTRREIRREVQAQMQHVMQAGIHPTHLDSHQHVHLLPGVFEIALEAARDAGIAVIRVPREPRSGLGWDARGLQLRVLRLLCRRAERLARSSKLRVVPHFRGLAVSGALDAAALLQVLARAGAGVTEVMSHPGYSDHALRQKYRWGYAWDSEAQALQSTAARRMVESRHIRLAHFGQAWDD